jgi:hypothetical protein
MTDHAHELRLYAPLLGRPTIMLAAADEIERLQSVIAGLRADFETAHARMMTSTAVEREACAAICDELESFWSAEKDAALLNGDVALSNASSGEPRAARAIAQAIRARGEK